MCSSHSSPVGCLSLMWNGPALSVMLFISKQHSLHKVNVNVLIIIYVYTSKPLEAFLPYFPRFHYDGGAPHACV